MVEKTQNESLYNLLVLSKAPVTLVNEDGIEVGFEKGMKGVVQSLDFSNDGEAFIALNATDFLEHNKSVATPSYYDKDNQPTQTVFDADLYKPVDSIFLFEGEEDPVVVPDKGPILDLFNHIKDHYRHLSLSEALLTIAGSTPDKDKYIAESGQTYIFGKNYFSEVGDIAPSLAVGTYHFSEDDGSCIKTPDDTQLVQWNDSVSQSFLKNAFKPEDGHDIVSGTKALKGRFGIAVSCEEGEDSRKFFFDERIAKLSQSDIEMLREVGNITGLINKAIQNIPLDLERLNSLKQTAQKNTATPAP